MRYLAIIVLFEALALAAAFGAFGRALDSLVINQGLSGFALLGHVGALQACLLFRAFELFRAARR